MMNVKRSFQCGLAYAIVFAAFFAPSAVTAQDLTPRERELILVIEDLKQRVEKLEKAQRDAETAEEVVQEQAGELSDRVGELESQIESVPGAGYGDLRLHWNEGIRLDSRDGQVKLKLFGRIQNDWGWWSVGDSITAAEPGVESGTGTEFRRARMGIGGTIYERYEFKAQFDFAGQDVDFNDVYLAFNQVPHLGQIKVGHFKEPMGLEVLTSSKDNTFMERSLMNLQYSGRNTGIQVANSRFDERMTWAAGWFRPVDNSGGGTSNGWNLTGRVAGLPYSKDDTHFLHLGLSGRYSDVDEVFGYSTNPENHFLDPLTSFEVNADSALTVGSEAAFVYGRYSLQGEFGFTGIDGATSANDRDVWGYYVQTSAFLTDDHRAYKKSSGAFGKVRPKNDFNWFKKGGWGAWEVAARWSDTDLDLGVEANGITLGLNWYLNPNMKIMVNYLHTNVKRPEDLRDPLDPADNALAFDDSIDAFLTRLQVTW